MLQHLRNCTSMENIYHHFQSSVRPLIMSCFALHCHCFLLPYTNKTGLSFGPCLDLHFHCFTAWVDQFLFARLVQCAVVTFVTPKLSRPEDPGIWGLMTCDSKLLWNFKTLFSAIPGSGLHSYTLAKVLGDKGLCIFNRCVLHIASCLTCNKGDSFEVWQSGKRQKQLEHSVQQWSV